MKSLERVLEEEDPFLLTGSPPCEAFSPLQGLNKDRVDPLVREERLSTGRQHLKTACDMYKRQYRRKRYFLHEHPKAAASWKEECVKEVMALPGVMVVQGPMCRWKMTAEDATGPRFVRKETCWMTNCAELARTLPGVCENQKSTGEWHRHVHLVNGRAKMARIYLPRLVTAILKAVKKQMELGGEYRNVNYVDVGPNPEAVGPSPEEYVELEEYEEDYYPKVTNKIVGSESGSSEEQIYYDDITGVQLSTEGVLGARKEELDWLKKAEVYEKRTIEECWNETGKAPITLKWIDRNKGDSAKPNYRSRIVVREVKKQHGALPGHMLFSNMPLWKQQRYFAQNLQQRRLVRKGAHFG